MYLYNIKNIDVIVFKKIKRLRHYMKVVDDNINELNLKYSGDGTMNTYKIVKIKRDNAYRIYTVLNFDQNLYKTYDNRFIDLGVRKFVKEFTEDLNSKGLREMIKIHEISAIGESSAFVSFEFRDINIAKWKLIFNFVVGISIFVLSLYIISLFF